MVKQIGKKKMILILEKIPDLFRFPLPAYFPLSEF